MTAIKPHTKRNQLHFADIRTKKLVHTSHDAWMLDNAQNKALANQNLSLHICAAWKRINLLRIIQNTSNVLYIRFFQKIRTCVTQILQCII